MSDYWSPWVWRTEHNCYERHRQRSNGDWVYDYDTKSAPPHNIPREFDHNALADVTNMMGNLSYDASSYPSNSMGAAGPSNLWPETGMAQRGDFQSASGTRIRTRDPDARVDLDPKFKTHRSKEFAFGRIFKVLWSEPNGSGGTEITALFGQHAHHKIRRFVIIRNRKGHCICLPILTYGGQGTTKYGSHPEDHAVIYSSKEGGPQYLYNETKIIKKPIRCDIKQPEEKLDPASRLNYAKLYTVEHNVKVMFIGRVATKYEQQIVTDYNNTHPSLEDRPYSGEGDYSPDERLGAEGEDTGYSLDPSSVGFTSGRASGVADGSSSHGAPTFSHYNEPYGSADVQGDDRRR